MEKVTKIETINQSENVNIKFSLPFSERDYEKY